MTLCSQNPQNLPIVCYQQLLPDGDRTKCPDRTASSFLLPKPSPQKNLRKQARNRLSFAVHGSASPFPDVLSGNCCYF